MESSGLFSVLGFRGRLGGLNIFGPSPLEIPTRKVVINKHSVTKASIKHCLPFVLNNKLYTYNWGKNWEKEEIPLSPPPPTLIIYIPHHVFPSDCPVV